MDTLFWIALGLSLPVFYVIGAITFFRSIFGKNKKKLSQSNFFAQAIKEINTFLHQHEKGSIDELITYFKEQQQAAEKSEEKDLAKRDLEASDTGRDKDAEAFISEERIPTHHKKEIQTDLWGNWYKENSINLLLYVGSFFIVASASIFVGFQWESIGQEIKAILLTILTLSFLGSGFLFFKNPKVKNAGITFSAIGALLIPLTGVGWYNFVLKNMDISFGMTWFATSIIALAIYISLGLYFKSKFYGYITALAVWSLSLSFVSLAGLEDKFYILASIISNFFILGFYLLSKTKTDDITEVFSDPLQISTNILMPATLVFGLMTAFSENIFFSLEVSISLFLASVYYYVFYSFNQKIWQLGTSLVIFPIFLLSLFGWQGIDDYRLYYAEIILGLADIGIAYIMIKNKLEQSALLSTGIGIGISILSASAMFISDPGTPHLLITSSLLGIVGIAAFYVHQKYEFLHLTSISLIVFIYILVHNLIGLGNYQYILGLIYLIIGAASFIGVYLTKKTQSLAIVFTIFSALSLMLGFLFSLSNEYMVLTCFITYAAIFFSASALFKNNIFIFPSNLFISISLNQIISIFGIELYYQPFMYSALAVGLYGLSYLYEIGEDMEKSNRYKLSSFVLALATPFYFANQSIFLNPAIEQSALITAYIATLLLGFEASRNKNEMFRYFTSAIAMVTLIWQINYLDFINLQWYAIPLGIYFLSLGYSRKLKDDENGDQTLSSLGMAIIILSSLSQAFASDGAPYALLLGGEGILFILLGISTNNKIYRISGIVAVVLAVLSQTYSYLFSLPRWLITGLAGLIFLAVAVYLLIKRTPNDK